MNVTVIALRWPTIALEGIAPSINGRLGVKVMACVVSVVIRAILGVKNMGDNLLMGWAEIDDFLKIPMRSAQRRRTMLIEAGVIFPRVTGRPPRKIVCAWESNLVRLSMLRGQKWERF